MLKIDNRVLFSREGQNVSRCVLDASGPSNLTGATSQMMITRIINDYMKGLQYAIDDAERLMSFRNRNRQLAIERVFEILDHFHSYVNDREEFVRYIIQ